MASGQARSVTIPLISPFCLSRAVLSLLYGQNRCIHLPDPDLFSMQLLGGDHVRRFFCRQAECEVSPRRRLPCRQE